MNNINIYIDINNIINYNINHIDDIDDMRRKEVIKMKINNAKLEIAMGNAIMSSKSLSEITGITQETIARIKNGNQNPKPATIGKIAKALNVRVEDLIQNQKEGE